MTLDAYRTLYESSIAFGMRKALMEEEGKGDMAKKVRICCIICHIRLRRLRKRTRI